MRQTDISLLITPETRDAAREFFAPPEGAPWRWEERGEVLAWRDGTTLAFADELALIFRRLEPRRLENFEALVVLLAACRGRRWPVPENVAPPLEEVRAGLERIAELPKADTATPEQRAELVDAVLSCRAGGEGLSPLNLLESWRVDETLRRSPRVRQASAAAGVRMLLSLRAGLRKFSVERLRLRRRTGLEEPPETFEDERPAEDLRQWLEVLSAEDGPEGLVARLSRRMLAALRLPSSRAAGAETGAGGLADIATRGAPERLLLTELAQDDEFFTARLAHGEALYRRREPESGAPEPVPAVLLDTTLRLWGAARPLAAAAALALRAARRRREKRTETKGECAVISQGMPLAAEWRTRQGLTATLETLDASLDPLPALRAFVARGEDEREIFFVTHAETVARPEFRAALAELTPLWIAAVDASGGFTLWRRREGRALETVCRAVISLNGLSPAKAAEARPAPALPQPGRLPLFLLQDPAPLLTAPRGRLEWALPDPEKPGDPPANPGWTGLTSSGQVARGTTRDRGVIEWTQRHTPGTVLAAARRRDGALIALTATNAQRAAPVVTVTGPRGEERRFPVSELPAWNLVAMDENAACFIDGANVYPRALTDGVSLPPLRLPGKVRRVFPGPVCECEGGVWIRLAWNGVRVEAVGIPVSGSRGTLAAWVEAASGLVRIMRVDGNVYSPGMEGEGVSMGFAPDGKAEVSVAPGGGALLVDEASGARQEVTLAPWLQVSRGYRAHEMFKRCGAVDAPAGPGVITNVGAAALDAEGRLWLQRRNAWLRLERMTPPGPKWTLADPPDTWVRHGVFLPRRVEKELPEQQALEHPGGALWLDARGLLHVFAWTPGLKEVTLTLTGKPGAVWLSDGARGGEAFFIGESREPSAPALEAADQALRELLEVWRRSPQSGDA